jgi:hypothetical protein
MTKHAKHIFESVIALDGIPGITAGTKGLVTGTGFRSLSILWDGKTQPADYERPAIDFKLQDIKALPSPAKRVSKPKKTEVSPAV